MGRSNKKTKIAWLVVFALGLATGCTRQLITQMSEESSSRGQQLPFERLADKRGTSPSARFLPGVIPAGTRIVVRLHSSLSSGFSHPGDSFEAVLDEPVIVQGQIVAPQGAAITGKVLDAKPSGEVKDAGYVRLVLTAVSLNGKFTSIQTSSIFAKGGPRGNRKPEVLGASIPSAGKSSTMVPSGRQDVRYDTDQRLTFRLTESLPLRRLNDPLISIRSRQN